MSIDYCFAAFEPSLADEIRLHPAAVCQSQLCPGEPCQMATGANCDDNMAADDAEVMRALDYIHEMCLDRPCPECRSEVIDKPQDDLRQCRACGHVWGFDDTQNLEDFVKEFGRMQPCIVCDNDSLDKFEVVENRDGRQELVCLNCHSVQGTERLVRDGNIHDFEDITMDQEGCGHLEPDLPDPNRPDAGLLACPFCPEMTYDFFEKEFVHDELVRVVCPGCSYVVFFREQDDGINDRRAHEREFDCRRVPEDDGRAQEDRINGRRRRTDEKREKEEAGYNDEIQPLPPVKKTSRFLRVKPVELAQRALQKCAESDDLEVDRLVPRLKNAVSTQAPVMGEQLGWAIGTAVGSIVFKNPEGAGLTGTVGSIVGRGVCNVIARAVQRRRV